RPGVLARLQHDRVAAEVERTELETGAGAHGRIEEHQRDRTPLERIAQAFALEAGGVHQQRVQFGAAPVLRVEEMLHLGVRVDGRWMRPSETKKPSLWLGSGMTATLVRSAQLSRRDPVDARAGSCPTPCGRRSGRRRWQEGAARHESSHAAHCTATGCARAQGVSSETTGVTEIRTRTRLPGSLGRRERYFTPRCT